MALLDATEKAVFVRERALGPNFVNGIVIPCESNQRQFDLSRTGERTYVGEGGGECDEEDDGNDHSTEVDSLFG